MKKSCNGVSSSTEKRVCINFKESWRQKIEFQNIRELNAFSAKSLKVLCKKLQKIVSKEKS